MAKFKQIFGGTIKCKVEAEFMISAYELAKLKMSPLECLLEIEDCKGGELVWKGGFRSTLAAEIANGIEEKRLGIILYQVIQLQHDLTQLGLNRKKVILSPDYIFVDSETGKIKIIYYPVNGEKLSYDAVLFAEDLILAAKLNGTERNQWNVWAETLQKTENYIMALQNIPTNGLKKEIERNRNYENDPPTTGGTNPEFGKGNGWEDDPPTTKGTNPEFGKENSWEKNAYWDVDDDGEALTDADDSLKVNRINQSQIRIVIVRISTGERISITKSSFVIGRSNRKTDYCIPDNPKIGRIHATIIKKGNSFFVIDNNSRNGTMVDGKTLIPGQEPVPIYNGSILVLDSEKFRFEIG